MKSYYPIVLDRPYGTESQEGISIRDKLAHDYLMVLLQRGDPDVPMGNFGLPENYENLIESSYDLADKMIEHSKQ